MTALKPTWTFTLPNERRIGARSPVVAGNTVYVVFTYDKRDFFESRITAFDLAGGIQRWTHVVEHVLTEPVVAENGTAYCSSFEGSVYAFDVNGSLLWKAPDAGRNMGAPCLVGDDRLVVAEAGGGARRTWCLNRTSGETLWCYEHGGLASPLMSCDDRVFHGSMPSKPASANDKATLLCVSTTNGKVIWSAPDEHAFLFNPIILDGKLFICSSRTLQAYSTSDGKRLTELALGPHNATLRLSQLSEWLVIWRDSHGQGDDAILAVQPALQKRFLRGPLLELHQQWQVPEHRGLCESPKLMSDGRLTYLTHDGTICTLDRSNGEKVNELRLRTKPNSSGGLGITGRSFIVAHGRDVFCFPL
jgi:outer membrane protein assembly factor BamB